MHPAKLSLKSELFPLLLIAVSIIIAFYLQVYFPDQVPVHWNINGDVDGYGGRFFAAWFVPLLLIFSYLLFLGIPYVDPKRNNYDKFSQAYHGIKNLFVAFLFLLYIFVGLAGLGFVVPVGVIFPAMVGLFFIGLGYFLKSVKQNWSIGVRTPWTIESPVAWKKSNELMARLLMLGGVVFILCAFPIGYLCKIYLLVFILVVIAVVPIAYSYFVFQQEKKKK